MIGTLENPTLDLDPSKPDTLNVITAVRTGVATYTDASGLIQSASANTVRVDNSLGYPAMLIEPSATNLVTHSEDFSNSAWTKTSYGTGVVPVVTANNAFSPDGTQNASRVVFSTGDGTTTSEESFITDTIPTTIGVSYTESFYLKGDVGGEQIIVRAGGGSAYTTLTLTTEWVRYEVTEAAIASTTYFQIGLRQGLSGVVINSEITVHIWGAQLEAGSVATSYIPTSGGNEAARTRAADDLSITGSAFSDFFNASEGTTYIEAVPNSSSNAPTLFEYFDASDASNQIMGSYISGITISYYVKTNGSFVAINSIGNVNLNQLNRIAVSYKTNDILGSLNGAAEVPDTSAALPTGIDKVSLGNDNSGNFSITGRIRRLIYWPTHSDSL